MELLRESITLGSPRGRLLAFVVVTVLVFVMPYGWLSHLSLWQALGWTSAPSIGLTRAYHLLLHGHPFAAWHRNKLIYPALVIWFGIVSFDIFQLCLRRTPTRVFQE